MKITTKGSEEGKHRIFNNCEEQTTSVKTLQCYAVYWIRRYTDGSELWTYLYTYCDGGSICGGGGPPPGGGTPSEPPVPISSFREFPPNPIDGEKYVLIYPSGSRSEFTFDTSLNLWLAEEVAVLAELGYTLSLNSGPNNVAAGSILSTLALGAVVEPTPAGEIIIGGVALGVGITFAAYYIYDLIEWYATHDPDLHGHCVAYYVGCKFQTSYACDDCLRFCLTQGVWDQLRCPGVTPLFN